MTSFMAVPGFELWADLQRQVAANFAKAAMLPMIAFSSMARAAAGPEPRQTRATEDPKDRRAPEPAVAGKSRTGSNQPERASEGAEQRISAAHAKFKDAVDERGQALQSATAAVLEAGKSVTSALTESAGRHSTKRAEGAPADDVECVTAAARKAAETLQNTIEELGKIARELNRVARTSQRTKEAGNNRAHDAVKPSKDTPKKPNTRAKSASTKSSGVKSARGSSRGSNGRRRKSSGSGARATH